MELSGVIVLALVSCVTSTPHGYGVKGGAVAKAEASAVSGAYSALPVVPLSIPSNGGYSGSFSKSSSSSFSSSSSSASSSSSSFSFSGSGANSIGRHNLTPTLHGSPNLQNGFSASGATSSATADASAISGTSSFSVGGVPCTSGGCGSSGNQYNVNNNNGCSSGQCHTSTSSAPSSNSNDANSQTGYSPSIQQPYDSDEFEVNIGGKSKYQLDCTHGKCPPNSDSKPSSVSDTSSINQYKNPSINKCEGSDCDVFVPLSPSGSNPVISHEKPATHLLAPNIGSACTTHDCNSLTGENLNNGKPSSYNVPILGTNINDASPQYNTQNSAPLYNVHSVPATELTNGAPKIPEHADTTYSPKFPIDSTGSLNCKDSNCGSPSASGPKSTSGVESSYSGCKTPNCNFDSSLTNDNAYGTNPQPNYLQPGTSAPNQQTYGLSGTNAKPDTIQPGYSAHPGHDDGSVKPGSLTNLGSLNAAGPNIHSDIPKPSTGVISPNRNSPTYTGGFGAPIGSFSSSFGEPKPTYDNIHPITKPYNQGTISGSGLNSIDLSKPNSIVPSSQNTALYTGGFGGAAGSINKNTDTAAHFQSQSNHGKPFYPGSPTQNDNFGASPSGQDTFGLSKPNLGVSPNPNIPSYHSTNGFITPVNSFNVNSGINSITTKPNVATEGLQVSGQGSLGTLKPNSGVGTVNQQTPLYTGGFGGPPGTFTTSGGIGTHFLGKPANNQVSTDHNTAHDIGNIPNSGLGAYPHDIKKPSESLIPPVLDENIGGGTNILNPKPGEKQKPVYTGGFGGPAGLLKPNEYSLSTKLPSLPINNNDPISCANGGDCGSNVIQSTPGGKPGATSPGAIASAEAKATTYSGGFGGPAGLLKPNEYSLSTKLPSSPLNNNDPISCVNGGDCGSKVIQSTPGGKPDVTSSGTIASAEAEATTYSGGFGGPPGLLKPFDDSKNNKNGQAQFNSNDGSQEHDHSLSNDNKPYAPILNGNDAGDINKIPNGSGSGANADANANAVAFASSNAFSTSQGSTPLGCHSGCVPNNDSGSHANNASGLSQSKTSGANEHNSSVGSIASASASANSAARAGAGALGAARSFGGSSATAHASAGAAVKGGYGR